MDMDEKHKEGAEALAEKIYYVRMAEKDMPEMYSAALEHLAKKGKIINSFEDLKKFREERNAVEQEIESGGKDSEESDEE